MTVSEETRHRLYLRLEEVLGPDEATVLMEHLPPGGWADVATKRDVDALAAETRLHLGALATETKRGIEGLATETRLHLGVLAMATSALRENLGGLETRMDTKMDLKLDAFGSRVEARLEHGLRGMEHELRLFTWRVMLAMLTLASLAVAAARL